MALANKLWDAVTGELLENLLLHGEVTSVCFSADGKQIASALHSGIVDVELWDVATGEADHP